MRSRCDRCPLAELAGGDDETVEVLVITHADADVAPTSSQAPVLGERRVGTAMLGGHREHYAAAQVGQLAREHGSGHMKSTGSVVMLFDHADQRVMLAVDTTHDTEDSILARYSPDFLERRPAEAYHRTMTSIIHSERPDWLWLGDAKAKANPARISVSPPSRARP